eukprot:TRINITY_DN181_c0_g1_i4.p1 TRINITY_DN181_c0_g1~~TRINITY_DN181_c0_g1_i4.p1  ORF type:complete len:258 (-),score=50.06 TRINITY_DN181_c0_g1_i4:1-774(-)
MSASKRIENSESDYPKLLREILVKLTGLANHQRDFYKEIADISNFSYLAAVEEEIMPLETGDPLTQKGIPNHLSVSMATTRIMLLLRKIWDTEESIVNMYKIELKKLASQIKNSKTQTPGREDISILQRELATLRDNIEELTREKRQYEKKLEIKDEIIKEINGKVETFELKNISLSRCNEKLQQELEQIRASHLRAINPSLLQRTFDEGSKTSPKNSMEILAELKPLVMNYFMLAKEMTNLNELIRDELFLSLIHI